MNVPWPRSTIFTPYGASASVVSDSGVLPSMNGRPVTARTASRCASSRTPIRKMPSTPVSAYAATRSTASSRLVALMACVRPRMTVASSWRAATAARSLPVISSSGMSSSLPPEP